MLRFLLYWLLSGLVPLLPERFGYWLFERAGDIAYLLARNYRAAYIDNIKHVLGPDAGPARLNYIARRAFQNLLKNYYDLFRGHSLSEQQLLAELSRLDGFEYVEQGLAQGHGVIAASAHFGNFNLVIRLTAIYLKGHRVVVPNERLKPERLFRLVVRQRAAQGIDIVPVDVVTRALVKTLKSGGLAGLALDLDPTHSGLVVDFFGAPARLPDGAVALALKYDAPLVVGFSRRLDDNRCEIVIEPVQFQRTSSLAADVRSGVAQVARLLESWIGKYPEQWIMFTRIWKEDHAQTGV